MKPKLNNSDFIQLSCELAHNRVTEEEPHFNAYSVDGKYTEAGQDVFNEFYDYYQHILKKYIEEDLC